MISIKNLNPSNNLTEKIKTDISDLPILLISELDNICLSSGNGMVKLQFN